MKYLKRIQTYFAAKPSMLTYSLTRPILVTFPEHQLGSHVTSLKSIIPQLSTDLCSGLISNRNANKSINFN